MAQAIDNTLTFKNINCERYVRINYENDFFSSTDIYYTQGIHLELVSPGLKKFLPNRILWHPRHGYKRYGAGLEHEGYTPTSLGSDHILYGDRPFAACLFAKLFMITTDPKAKQWVSTSVSAGITGPAAGGMEMQTFIHRNLHDIIPHGWEYQVHNDAILNYQINYEKALLTYGHLFSIDADGMARAGTLSDKGSAGITIMAGYFDSPFTAITSARSNFRIYAYEHAELAAIGYDATMQGGLFDKDSPYTISAKDITRATFQNRFGIVVVYRRVYLEYFQSLLSREFNDGNYHVWGGVQLAFGL